MDALTITTKIADYAGGKLLDKLAQRFQGDVIQRWTKKRAESFFEVFCEEVVKEYVGSENDNIDVLLDMILEDEIRTEVLFDSYRRVCMARSKSMGPRIIGILTAQLVTKGVLAEEADECIFMAAEQLSDDELLAFAVFYEENEREALSDKKGKQANFKYGVLEILWSKEHIDSNWSSTKENVSVGPLNLGECIGSWALKLKSLGILSDDVKQSEWDYKEDSERHRDQNGIMREIACWLYVSTAGTELRNLVRRVSDQRVEK